MFFSLRYVQALCLSHRYLPRKYLRKAERLGGSGVLSFLGVLEDHVEGPVAQPLHIPGTEAMEVRLPSQKTRPQAHHPSKRTVMHTGTPICTSERTGTGTSTGTSTDIGADAGAGAGAGAGTKLKPWVCPRVEKCTR